MLEVSIDSNHRYMTSLCGCGPIFSGPFGASLVRMELESTINNNFNGIYLHVVINRAPRALTGSRALGIMQMQSCFRICSL